MRVVAFLAPWVALGIAVIAVAFRGGPRRTAQAVGGERTGLRFGTPLLYVALGVVIPVAVIAARGAAVGGKGHLTAEKPDEQMVKGKAQFRANCASCHALAAVNAHGATGPNLDRIGQVTRERVLNAIRIGGTGKGRMPAGILQGTDAEAVADYVAKVAGQ